MSSRQLKLVSFFDEYLLKTPEEREEEAMVKKQSKR